MGVYLAAALVTSAAAAVLDWRRGEIPNWLSFGAFAAAAFGHLTIGIATLGLLQGVLEACWAVAGALVCGLVPFLFWRQGAFGGGDVKMLAAVGALLLPLQGIEAEFYSLIAAAVFAPARLAWDGKLFRTLGNTVAILMNPFLPQSRRRALTPEMLTSLRFGPAIFAGVAACALIHRGQR
jgi:prepilin peptidase CpaA